MLTLLEWIYTLVLVLSQLHLHIAGCDVGVQLSFRPSVRLLTIIIHVESSTVKVYFSAPVITASVKPCTEPVLYILFKHTPSVIDLQALSIFYV